jgi:hypothetical protein
MKKILLIALAVMFLVGCTTRNEYGNCVGINDDDRDPALRYKLDGWNIAMAVIFVETVVAPIIVIVDETYCPIGKKEVK